MNLSATPKDTCARGSSKPTAPNTGPGGEPGGLSTGFRPSRNRVSAAAQTTEGPGHSATRQHSVICPTTRCPPRGLILHPGWAPTPNLSQLKALPGSETLHDPYPRAAKPQLLSCRSRSLPTRPGSSLHASRSPGALCPAWSRLPARCPSAPDTPSPRHDLPKPPVFQGPVPRPPPSGVFPTVPSPPLGCHLPSLPCSQPFGPCLSPSLEWELTAGRDHGCSPRATWHKVWRAGQECGASSPTAEPTPCPAQPGCPSPAPPGCRR